MTASAAASSGRAPVRPPASPPSPAPGDLGTVHGFSLLGISDWSGCALEQAGPGFPQPGCTTAGLRDYLEAAQDLQEALGIYRDLGSRHGQAIALNDSGTLSRTRSDLGQAQAYHQQALDLARQIGSAPAEANALAGLARCARAEGRTADAETGLRQALAIFQRIGAAETADVSAELDALPGVPGPAPATP